MFVKTFWSIQNSKQLKVCSTTLNLVIQQMDKACFSGWAPGNTQGGQHEAGQWIIWMWSAGCWAGLGTCQLSEWQNTELKDSLMTARKSPREGPSSLHFHVLDFFPFHLESELKGKNHRGNNITSDTKIYAFLMLLLKLWEKNGKEKVNPEGLKGSFPRAVSVLNRFAWRLKAAHTSVGFKAHAVWVEKD